MGSEDRERPSVTFGHIAAERLAAERTEALRRQLEAQQERLEGRRDAIVARHPGAEPKKVRSARQPDLGGCLEIFVELPFRLFVRLLEFLLDVLGGLLEGLGDLG